MHLKSLMFQNVKYEIIINILAYRSYMNYILYEDLIWSISMEKHFERKRCTNTTCFASFNHYGELKINFKKYDE